MSVTPGEVTRAPRGRPLTILFVDRNDEKRDRILFALLHAGYLPLLAETGQQAVAVIADHRELIDLVFVDAGISDRDFAVIESEGLRRAIPGEPAGPRRVHRLPQSWSVEELVRLATTLRWLPPAPVLARS